MIIWLFEQIFLRRKWIYINFIIVLKTQIVKNSEFWYFISKNYILKLIWSLIFGFNRESFLIFFEKIEMKNYVQQSLYEQVIFEQKVENPRRVGHYSLELGSVLNELTMIIIVFIHMIK